MSTPLLLIAVSMLLPGPLAGDWIKGLDHGANGLSQVSRLILLS
jgi:hypothetical protein